MTAKLNAGTIANLSVAERFHAVKPYESKLVELTYRRSKVAPWRSLRARVVGAAIHGTNGNSTGDLVIAPEELGNVFVSDDGSRSPFMLISLANIKRLEVTQ